ncbi:hypothetical protein [Halalkalibacterium halodurans]|uniref:hypothetical protein n=1 Tax=Halalkalibacterium halodurans TaxID=86665 RepID=UPI0010FD235A|nr:hypothetical protein [Halalkalibacterium halodurans]
MKEQGQQAFLDILNDLAKETPRDSLDRESYLSRFKALYSKYQRHYYAELTQLVFFVFHEEDAEMLDENLLYLIEHEKDDDLKKKLHKMQDHIQLTINQKRYYEQIQANVIDHFNKERVRFHINQKKLTDKIESTNQIVSQTTKKWEDTEEKLSNFSSRLYAEFIVVLGIFTTIIFASFGGFEIGSSIFRNIVEVSTGKLMVFGSMSIGAMLLLLFLLINSISKLTDFNIRSCGCSTNDKCNHNSFQKHPLVVIGFFILTYIFVLGITQYFFDYEKELKAVFNFNFSLSSLSLALMCAFLFIFGYFLWVIFKFNYNYNRNEIRGFWEFFKYFNPMYSGQEKFDKGQFHTSEKVKTPLSD